MRRFTFIDPIAELLLGMRRVSPSHWTLRLLGAAGALGALVLATDAGLFASLLTGVVTCAVLVALLGQLLNPDSALGIIVPLSIIIGLAALPDLSVIRAAAAGLALLVSHAAFALAATLPAHGEIDRSAWSLWLRTLVPVLPLTLVFSLTAFVLAGFRLGPWMLVVGTVSVVVLLAVLLPRQRIR